MTTIRQARPDDLPAILAVQLESWRRTYRGVLPSAYLGAPVARDLGAIWTPDRLNKIMVMVAERDHQILGVAATIPEHADGPYLDNLHVAKSAEGTGVGRALMAGTAAELVALGYETLHLTVVETNERALAFYVRLGGEVGASIDDAMFDHPVRAFPIRWQRLAGLASGCA